MVINDLKRLDVQLYMHVPAATLAALHIFKKEHHPLAAVKGGGGGSGSNAAKEGFSLFSLLDYTQSKPGRQLLKEWMLQPLLDIDMIRQRQDGVQLFLQPELQTLGASLLEWLRRMAAPQPLIFRIQKCAAQPRDYLQILKSLAAVLSMCDLLREQVLYELEHACAMGNDDNNEDNEENRLHNGDEDDSGGDVEKLKGNDNFHQANQPILRRFVAFVQNILHRCHVHELYELHERILATLDDDATEEFGSVVIRQGFSATLDQYKSQYQALNGTYLRLGSDVCARIAWFLPNLTRLAEIMENVRRELGEQYPPLEPYLGVHFMPQVGFLVIFPKSPRWEKEGSLPEDFRFLFVENDVVAYKSDVCHELDERYGDLDGAIKDAEHLIVAELEDDILDKEMEIRETFAALAELDVIMGFASCAADNRWERPEVVEADEYCLVLRKGRHPLQELLLENQFVANDTYVDEEKRVNIITGPNFSGKSCYTRQGTSRPDQQQFPLTDCRNDDSCTPLLSRSSRHSGLHESPWLLHSL